MSDLQTQAKSISRAKKERFLLMMSENEFRDKVVRPLFLILGMKDGRDCCGPSEAGKDAIFIAEDKIGLIEISVVQTKKGPLKLAKEVSSNVVEATTQIKTALATKIALPNLRQKRIPNKIYLCASGKINSSARDYIVDNIDNPNIVFLGADEIIPLIDDNMPELWFDMNAEVLPYIKSLKHSIEEETQLFTRGELVGTGLSPVATTDSFFVQIPVFHYVTKYKKVRGTMQQTAMIEKFPVTALLDKKDPLILLFGDAGSGKSTAMLRMAYILCEKTESEEKHFKIPVFIRAQELTENTSSLLDLCISRTREISKSQTVAFQKSDLQRGNVTILIDALDEIPNIDHQKQAIKKIIDFNKLYSKCKIILSSRDYHHFEKMDLLEHFSHFHMGSINYKQALAIIKRLQKNKNNLPVLQSQEFLRKLQNVHGLELNPLIVTVFAASSEYSRQDIPANITELFKKFTEMMLGRWDETKGISQQYVAPLKDFMLKQIAYIMHKGKRTQISIGDFKSLLAEELINRGYKADVEILTEEILIRSGLFRKIGNMVEFKHLMLQEFFAGRGIPENDIVECLVADPWWRRALVFFFGDKPNQKELLKSITGNFSISEPSVKYSAAVTIGLALQASYLLEVAIKVPLIQWIIQTFSESFQDYDSKIVRSSPHPLKDFLSYYLFARDAVALGIMADHKNEIFEGLTKHPTKNALEKDLKHFWLITGLIESGALEEAEKELKKFSPTDMRLYLGIHLGCYLIVHLRIVTQEERKTAKRICESISKYLPDLRKQLIEEFKSELLEIQRDEIKSINGKIL